MLTLVAGGEPGVFQAGLPPGAPGQWCRLIVQVADRASGAPGPQQPDRWWAKLEAVDEARGHIVRESFLGGLRGRPGHNWRSTLLHLPAEARALTLRVFRADEAARLAPTARLDVLTRRQAAGALLAHGWRILPRALAGGLPGLPGRVRVMLGQAPARAGEPPPYDVWVALYDAWPAGLRTALLSQAGQVAPVEVVVTGAGPEASLASVQRQWLRPVAVTRVAAPAEWQPAGAEWVLILQAGELLAPQALACFAHAIRMQPGALGFYADVDRLAAGYRSAPLFKPSCDPWLLPSGLLTAGGCLFRADHASRHSANNGVEWRLAAASAMPSGAFRRLPLLLTHVTAPVKVRRTPAPQAGAHQPPVTIVIPSSGRSAHALRCLRRVLATTRYPRLDVLVAVSHADPGDTVQNARLLQMGSLPGVRVLELGMRQFNYAAVNNAAVRQARGELVLLLNDDVVPVEPTWLQRMVAYLEAPYPAHAGIVGARLLYGNNRVQHGGVVMGLANLCEHAFRVSGRREGGPYGIALLDRQVSAVTGACMLLRRCFYETVGGMDEAFAVALNDVDFCLRASEGGARIVLAAGVELYHYESLSLGRHYEGSRAGLEALEVSRLRQRWFSTIADDPFYSPLASLEPGREFCPAFPPRATPLSWSMRDTAGQG